MKLSRLLGLSAGHLICDINQGAVVILVPVVKVSLGLSIGSAALLVSATTVMSSIIQPLFGVLSDRFDLRWMIPAGVALAGVGVAVAGLVPNYPLLLGAVLVSGLGVAAFHPEASRWAGSAAGPRRATGMSVFSVGGNAGFALGVFATAPLLVAAGREGTKWLAVLPLAYALLIIPMLIGFGPARGQGEAAPIMSPVRAALTPTMGLLVAIIGVRSVISIGITALAPLYLNLSRGLSLTTAAAVTGGYLFAGACGTLLGGPLADRFGRRRQIQVSFAVLAPLGLVFLLVPGLPGYAALILFGGAIVSTFAITVTMAQELMPAHQGTATGITLGFAFGAGGIAAGLLGRLADVIGLQSALLLLVVLPLVALPLVARLPETGDRPPSARPREPLSVHP
jgi:FSR family fosmidomycin resistance protein-like MFS transporter